MYAYFFRIHDNYISLSKGNFYFLNSHTVDIGCLNKSDLTLPTLQYSNLSINARFILRCLLGEVSYEEMR